jgi:hypothetical protein
LDFSQSWALTAFAWAFEGSGNARESSELAVRLACIWLVYDADKLWFKISDAQADQNTLERWNHWRQGLMDSQARYSNRTTSKLIAHALALMQSTQDNAQ